MCVQAHDLHVVTCLSSSSSPAGSSSSGFHKVCQSTWFAVLSLVLTVGNSIVIAAQTHLLVDGAMVEAFGGVAPSYGHWPGALQLMQRLFLVRRGCFWGSCPKDSDGDTVRPEVWSSGLSPNTEVEFSGFQEYPFFQSYRLCEAAVI